MITQDQAKAIQYCDHCRDNNTWEPACRTFPGETTLHLCHAHADSDVMFGAQRGSRLIPESAELAAWDASTPEERDEALGGNCTIGDQR